MEFNNSILTFNNLISGTQSVFNNTSSPSDNPNQQTTFSDTSSWLLSSEKHSTFQPSLPKNDFLNGKSQLYLMSPPSSPLHSRVNNQPNQSPYLNKDEGSHTHQLFNAKVNNPSTLRNQIVFDVIDSDPNLTPQLNLQEQINLKDDFISRFDNSFNSARQNQLRNQAKGNLSSSSLIVSDINSSPYTEKISPYMNSSDIEKHDHVESSEPFKQYSNASASLYSNDDLGFNSDYMGVKNVTSSNNSMYSIALPQVTAILDDTTGQGNNVFSNQYSSERFMSSMNSGLMSVIDNHRVNLKLKEDSNVWSSPRSMFLEDFSAHDYHLTTKTNDGTTSQEFVQHTNYQQFNVFDPTDDFMDIASDVNQSDTKSAPLTKGRNKRKSKLQSKLRVDQGCELDEASYNTLKNETLKRVNIDSSLVKPITHSTLMKIRMNRQGRRTKPLPGQQRHSCGSPATCPFANCKQETQRMLLLECHRMAEELIGEATLSLASTDSYQGRSNISQISNSDLEELQSISDDLKTAIKKGSGNLRVDLARVSKELRLKVAKVRQRKESGNLNAFTEFAGSFSASDDSAELVKPWCCTWCPQRFTRKYEKIRHERVKHMNIRPYVCDTCGKTFARTDALQRHRAVEERPLARSTSH